MADDPNQRKIDKAKNKKEFSDKLRTSLQESLEQAREERKKELFMKRVDLAKSGIVSYDTRRLADSVKSFGKYLNIVEDWKKVPEGGLHPRYFDREKDIAELLLISGIYWDLAKIYDYAKSKEKLKEFQHYLEKFVLFSKGFPYEHVCRETLRKYISMGKPVHKVEFNEAYKRLGGGDCFIVTELSDQLSLSSIVSLRIFRDEFLIHRLWGKKLISFYYQYSPEWSSRLAELPKNHWKRRALARGLGFLASILGFFRFDRP